MIIIRTSFEIDDHLLNQLFKLVQGEVDFLASFMNKIDFSSEFVLCDKFFLGVSNENTSSILSVQSLFYLSDNIGIGNEVNTLQLMIQGGGMPENLNVAAMTQPPFKIKNIKIFGEERAITWNESKKTNYFNQKVHRDIGDYYFNNSVLSFESCDGRCINFFSERDFVRLNFQKMLKIENNFYRVDQLFMGVEYITEPIYTTVPRIKCHYEIDENGIQKNINSAVTI